MSEKAKLTKAQASALEQALKSNDAETIIRKKANQFNIWGGDCSELNLIDLTTVARALLNGYEVIPEPITVTITLPPYKIEELRKEANERRVENWARGVRWAIKTLGISEEVLGE